MRFMTDVLLDAIDATQDTNSPAIDATQILKASLTIIAAGGGAGTLKLQASNDAPTTGTPTHWADIPNVSATISADGVTAIGAFDCCYRYIRANFTHSGTGGTITAKLQTQGF